MNKQLEGYRRFIYVGLIIIALGVVFTNTLADSVGSLGVVMIAVGGLFFIIGMNKKREEEIKGNDS